MPNPCRVVTVGDSDLPAGHRFVIVHSKTGVTVFCRSDDRSQLEGRIAFWEWDRARDASMADDAR